MELLRRTFSQKSPEGLFKIADRAYVFGSSFSACSLDQEVMHRTEVDNILTDLRKKFPDSSVLAYNFTEGQRTSLWTEILNEYRDVFVVEHPRHFEGCPLLCFQVLHSILNSAAGWLSSGNILLLHAETGGWGVLAFVLAGLLVYTSEQNLDEQKTLKSVQKQAPNGILQRLYTLNPIPSQIRYLRYISRRRTEGSNWPPPQKILTLDCVILRNLPNFDGKGGCKPIFRVYEVQDTSSGRTGVTLNHLLLSMSKQGKNVPHHTEMDYDVLKMDAYCRIQGDVMLECAHLHEGCAEREEMMFRVMFNSSFIRSNFLSLKWDEIDIAWDAKGRFSHDFRVEMSFSDAMNVGSPRSISVVSLDQSQPRDLQHEAILKVQEIFKSVDEFVVNGDTILHILRERLDEIKQIDRASPLICSSSLPPICYKISYKEGETLPNHYPKIAPLQCKSPPYERFRAPPLATLSGQGDHPPPLSPSHPPLSGQESFPPHPPHPPPPLSCQGTTPPPHLPPPPPLGVQGALYPSQLLPPLSTIECKGFPLPPPPPPLLVENQRGPPSPPPHLRSPTSCVVLTCSAPPLSPIRGPSPPLISNYSDPIPSPIRVTPSIASSTFKHVPLRALHWTKMTKATQGSLWVDVHNHGVADKVLEFDKFKLEDLFSTSLSTTIANSDSEKIVKRRRATQGSKSNIVHLIDLRRSIDCEIILAKIKVPLPNLMCVILSLDDSILNVDQVDNLVKCCPTKEEMDLLRGYTGNKANLGKCEQLFVEMMKVPRVETKLKLFSFKIQFPSRVLEIRKNLNLINLVTQEVTRSSKIHKIMQIILSLGNALNQGTTRGSTIGFRLESLLKLIDTHACNGNMNLMHYICKVIIEKLLDLLDFDKDLAHLEVGSKVQLKSLVEDVQFMRKGLEKVELEYIMSKNDGSMVGRFRKILKEFHEFAKEDVKSIISFYSEVAHNVDALARYFGEDPMHYSFEQVVSTLVNFVAIFRRARNENCKELNLDK